VPRLANEHIVFDGSRKHQASAFDLGFRRIARCVPVAERLMSQDVPRGARTPLRCRDGLDLPPSSPCTNTRRRND